MPPFQKGHKQFSKKRARSRSAKALNERAILLMDKVMQSLEKKMRKEKTLGAVDVDQLCKLQGRISIEADKEVKSHDAKKDALRKMSKDELLARLGQTPSVAVAPPPQEEEANAPEAAVS